MAFFLMRCRHQPGHDALRDEIRPEHRAWVASGGGGRVSVLIGAALIGDDGAAIGNFGLLEARTAADARAFAEGDPFNCAGIVSEIELTALPDTFQAHRIADPMSPRLPQEAPGAP
ncbi:YciI family protein [Actibacterium sp. MT2.3-13A]|uniref:YciI family protein n=1 Tax=Actibacterium sp. MT2.3-13A TaxID=2828332 RepID=UPI001BAD858F|nr:YciI family protein [Actibacterium sp. MT2.3-13A]